MMKFSVILISVLLVFTGITYILVREFMIAQPAICKTCHFIAPFYNKWERSTHNMVPCLKCHDYGPVRALLGQMRFLAGTYNPRPMTNVPDSKCLQQGCHERRLVESRVNLTKWNIVFDHKPHFMQEKSGMDLHCRSCHSDIVQGEHMKVSMNVCFLCHIDEKMSADHKTSCEICHNGPKKIVRYGGVAFDHLKPLEKGYTCLSCHISVKLGDGSVPKEKCFFCHIDRTGKYMDTLFVHRQHVTNKQIDCFYCHQFVEHGNIKLAKGIDKIIR